MTPSDPKDGPLAAHLRVYSIDRLVMLCDGVFAIAITLAAIEIHVPRSSPSLGAALRDVAPSLTTYLISFMVIAMFWMGNRDLFARVREVDKPLTGLVMGMLCLVALIPASTHMSQANGPVDGSLRFYALTMVAAGSLNCATWLYGLVRPAVMLPDVSRAYRWQRIVITATIPLLFGAVLVVPTTQALQWIAPVAIALVVARRFVLARVFPSVVVTPGSPTRADAA